MTILKSDYGPSPVYHLIDPFADGDVPWCSYVSDEQVTPATRAELDDDAQLCSYCRYLRNKQERDSKVDGHTEAQREVERIRKLRQGDSP